MNDEFASKLETRQGFLAEGNDLPGGAKIMRMNADDMLRYCNDPPAMGYCYSNDAPDWCECLPLVLATCGMARCLGSARVCMCSCWVKKRGATFTADDGWTTVIYKEELNVGLADVSLTRLTRISAFSHARMHARTRAWTFGQTGVS